MQKIGDIEHVSRGFVSFKPETPYVLPDPIVVGRRVPTAPVRTPRTDFKTRKTSSDFPVVLLVSSKPALTSNLESAVDSHDNFVGTVTVFNKHSEPVTIMSAGAEYRLVGDPEYAPVSDIQITNARFPITIDPRQSVGFKFVAYVPRAEEDLDLDIWWYRSVVARHKPLRLRFSVFDIENNAASIVLEYVFAPFSASPPNVDDLAYIRYDDWHVQSIYSMSIRPGRDDAVINIDTDYDEAALNRLVFRALKQGDTEIDLEINRNFDDRCVFNAWALIDVSCRRVYGFKLLMVPHESVQIKSQATLMYVACPDYGAITETRPISYAEEFIELPDLDPI
eukprot:jgi/Hompol1/4348/HPOL_007059-RA